MAFRVAGILEGPVALLLRIIWHASSGGRRAAAISFLWGSLLRRYAWIWAGRTSAKNSDALFSLQRGGEMKP